MTNDDGFLQNFENDTKKASHLQNQTLQDILQRNRGVLYLQRFLQGCGGGDIDAATFRRLVPLSSYDAYGDLINQLADGGDHGDPPLLSADPLVCFFYSSGTSTMKPKMVPSFGSKTSRAAMIVAFKTSDTIHQRLFPPKSNVKNLWLIYSGKLTTTKGGFKVSAISTMPLWNGDQDVANLFYPLCNSPVEVILGADLEPQTYCHLLCSLKNANLIDGIRAIHAVVVSRAFSLLESKWEQLCEDLKNGYANAAEVPDVNMRDAVTKFLGGPNPDLSTKIRAACEGNKWHGIVGKLWPNIRYIRCICTGIMQQYYPKLKYYVGEVPVIGSDFLSSECFLGMNMDPLQPPDKTRYVMDPTTAYFEFLPFDLKKNCALGHETRDFSTVEVGKTYEIVVTTHGGLYRYRLGDVVRVVGFHNSSPEVEFVMRAPTFPSQVVTEKDLIVAMEGFDSSLRQLMALKVEEFSCYLAMDSNPIQVKIFVEVRNPDAIFEREKLQKSMEKLKVACTYLEDGLGSLYKVQRERGQVDPLLISIVKSGCFNALAQSAIEKGAAASQYKSPKIVRKQEIADFLEKYVIVTVSMNKKPSER